MLAFLPQLYYLLIYLLCHFYHLVYALLPGRAGGVGAVGELVGVVAETRHLAQQVGVVSTGARLEFGTHDQGPQVFLAGQAAQVRLTVEMPQFLVIQPQRDLMRTFASCCQRSSSYRVRLGGRSVIR